MVWNRLTEWLFDYEPHPTVETREEFLAFHERVSLWALLRRHGIHPVVFSVLFLALVTVPGVVLTTGYDIDHPLVTVPMLGVLVGNTVLTLFGVFFIDRRFPTVLCRIRSAFDMDDAAYYGFVARFVERLYHLSFYSPVAPGPHDRDHRPRFWVSVAAMYVLWAVLIATAVPVELPATALGTVFLVVYYLFVIGYASLSLFTAVAFLGTAWLFLTFRASQFRIRLNLMAGDTHFGLDPFARFIYHTLLIGFGMVATAGVIGLVTANPLLLLFAVLMTPLLVGWFVGSIYGLHQAIVDTKRARLSRLHEKHAEDIDRVFLESTPEPDLQVVTNSDAFISLKNEIENLPNWPTDVRLVIEVLSVTVLSNIPSMIGLVL